MQPTDEQSTILSAATTTSTNLMVQAYAGCGKTSTLEMIEHAVNIRPILYLAFNRKIADDASERMLSTTTVRTFNSLGHRIWAKQCAKPLTLDPRKTQTLLRSLIDEVPKKDQAPLWDSYWSVIHGVGLAKSLGYIPDGKFTQTKPLIGRDGFHARLEEEPDDLCADLIDAVLTRSIARAFEGLIDYNDQVYMPALFGGTFPQFPLVLVDEAQDLNPTNHLLLHRLVKHRVIFVGDPFQSIYGFRGAVQGGMATLAERFTTKCLDLSISFRCPQAIVEAARWRVPHFKWNKEGGHVEVLDSCNWTALPDNCCILCRNNAPIFRLALHLLSVGRSVSVAGSDIGPKIIGLLNRLGPEEMPKASVVSAIEDWRAERLDRGSIVANDLADCMKVFATAGTDLGQAIRYAEHVLGQKGSIRLMTGHKAKGLEWEEVYHLDPWLCREDEQDQNLRYVIQTRSMDRYFEIDSNRIQWQ